MTTWLEVTGTVSDMGDYLGLKLSFTLCTSLGLLSHTDARERKALETNLTLELTVLYLRVPKGLLGSFMVQ